MPIKLDTRLTPARLLPKLERLFARSAGKILDLDRTWKPDRGAPVFTVKGRYTARGWTEWTEGFQFGSALLQFDAAGDARFLELGRRGTLARMATHISHTGVHDHGFNIVSTHGNLWRLMREGKVPASEAERNLHELALKVSGAVQAARWTRLADGTGFIHSFNGPHSLFVDTVRSLRSLAIAHQLGHELRGEQDARISLLGRLVEHALNTARYNVYHGEGRDAWDVRGRVAQEAIFNVTSGVFRCPNTQQGWSPFTTWTRGLAWALLGFAEELEFLATLHQGALDDVAGRLPWAAIVPGGERMDERRPGFTFTELCVRAAVATADFYLANCCADGIPMWDTGTPNLHRLPEDYLDKPADPFNDWEPVDSSAAAIAAQGLWRLGNYLTPSLPVRAAASVSRMAKRYCQAALTIADTLFAEPYLAMSPKHQGLIQHSVYHRPNGWDYVASGQKVPNGESSMWGDYHARELALVLLRAAQGGPYPTFFAPVG
ncbi:MAG: glycosyl hydrolase [Verrucomicrobiota bacterium]|jgi:hypothetical protein